MNGIIIVNKQSGFTSRDVVNKLNKIFNTKKIGHTGTLDPIASGVLVMCIGSYTKLVEELTSLDKEYIATIKLGLETDTLDTEGIILKEEIPKQLDLSKIIEVLNSFKGKSIQEVPAYSAVKIKGKKLYEYARNKEIINLPKREIEVFDIELLSYQDNEISFRVHVSKGTYIRSLIKDICSKLNLIGTMSYLQRIKQGDFDIKESYSLSDIENNNFRLLKLDDVFDYPIINLDEDNYFKVKNGNFIKLNCVKDKVILTYNKEEIAIYKKGKDYYKCHIMIKHQ